jgi:hypothetical protein
MKCPSLKVLTLANCTTIPVESPSLKSLALQSLFISNNRLRNISMPSIQAIINASSSTLCSIVIDRVQLETIEGLLNMKVLVDLEVNSWNDLWYIRFLHDSLPKLKRLALRRNCQMQTDLQYTFDELETLDIGSQNAITILDLCGCMSYISMWRVAKFPTLKSVDFRLDMSTVHSHALSQIARQLGPQIKLNIRPDSSREAFVFANRGTHSKHLLFGRLGKHKYVRSFYPSTQSWDSREDPGSLPRFYLHSHRPFVMRHSRDTSARNDAILGKPSYRIHNWVGKSM